MRLEALACSRCRDRHRNRYRGRYRYRNRNRVRFRYRPVRANHPMHSRAPAPVSSVLRELDHTRRPSDPAGRAVFQRQIRPTSPTSPTGLTSIQDTCVCATPTCTFHVTTSHDRPRTSHVNVDANGFRPTVHAKDPRCACARTPCGFSLEPWNRETFTCTFRSNVERAPVGRGT